MNPLVKKSLVAVAAKQAFDKINEKRHAEPSKGSRFGRFLLIAGGLGAAAFAYKSGLFNPLLDKVRGGKGGSSQTGSNGAGSGRDVTISSGDRSLSSPVA